MRVITGKYKGRKLAAPTNLTRPTLDRMKETLFNIINERLNDAVVLDLFAGSGQLAIESLSRCARRAILCDNSREALITVKTNFEKIGVKPELYFCDFRDCLKRLTDKLDIIFVDPPYKSGFYQEVLQIVSERQLLSESGLIVCEHAAEDELPVQIGDIACFDSRKIGTVKFSFYQRSKLCE